MSFYADLCQQQRLLHKNEKSSKLCRKYRQEINVANSTKIGYTIATKFSSRGSNKTGRFSFMEAVRQVIDSTLLNGIVSLPKSFERKKVEVIIFVREEKGKLPSLNKNEINNLLSGSITESLIGVIPQSNKTLNDYRSERLMKYETPI